MLPVLVIGAAVAVLYFVRRAPEEQEGGVSSDLGPFDSIGYVRGDPVALDLVAIGGGRYLERAAASSFFAMRAAAERDGITLQVNDAFRSMAQQQAFWADLQEGRRTAPVAPPGYSLHQSGEALDLDTDNGTNAASSWLDDNALRFGWRRTVRSEPWHFEFTSPENVS